MDQLFERTPVPNSAETPTGSSDRFIDEGRARIVKQETQILGRSNVNPPIPIDPDRFEENLTAGVLSALQTTNQV